MLYIYDSNLFYNWRKTMDNWYKYMFYDIIININNIIIEKNNEINISILIKRYSIYIFLIIFLFSYIS
jgi:hypothetical protein